MHFNGTPIFTLLIEMLPRTVSVGCQQTGYMKGRFIGTNIRKMIDILEYLEKEDMAVLIISVDFEKAFDSLEHDSIWMTFRYFGFGENFIQWIQLLSNKFELCTENNGHVSDWFMPTRAIHQVCPISGYNDILVAEMLAINIHKYRGYISM